MKGKPENSVPAFFAIENNQDPCGRTVNGLIKSMLDQYAVSVDIEYIGTRRDDLITIDELCSAHELSCQRGFNSYRQHEEIRRARGIFGLFKKPKKITCRRQCSHGFFCRYSDNYRNEKEKPKRIKYMTHIYLFVSGQKNILCYLPGFYYLSIVQYLKEISGIAPDTEVDLLKCTPPVEEEEQKCIFTLTIEDTPRKFEATFSSTCEKRMTVIREVSE